MSSADPPSRRDFLTGRAVRQGIERAGGRIADQLNPVRIAPAAGHTIRLETQAMACPWNVVMNPGPPEQVMQASAALDLVHPIEDQLTVYRETSEIARLNATAAGSPQPVADDLYAFLRWTQEMHRQTGGAFDSASLALIRIWRDCRLVHRIPTADEIAAARGRSGVDQVLFDDSSQTLQFLCDGLGFDLGACGKGYAVDQVAAALRKSGLLDFLIHGGHSSVFATGDHDGLGGWPVGIRNPLFPDRPWATLLLQDEALGTSGSNIQYFRHEGRRYGHILDPRTGWPAEGLLSVTVIAKSAATADAVSTALYVMGLEKAALWCKDHPEVAAILFPPADASGRLNPVVCNLADDRLFLDEDPPGETAPPA